MRLALASALLLLVAGCGGSDDSSANADRVKADASRAAAQESRAASSQKAVELQEGCDKLARTWAVAAEHLRSAIPLGLLDKAQGDYDSMVAATEQMDIDACPPNDVQGSALKGNYEAAKVLQKLGLCGISDDDCMGGAADLWIKNGVPLIEDVRLHVG